MPKSKHRPTAKELDEIKSKALDAVKKGRMDLLYEQALQEDAQAVGCSIDELPGVLTELLSGLEVEHYAGWRPPQRSYEEKIKGRELFAFTRYSVVLDWDIYFKFVFMDEYFILVSFHRDEEKLG